MTTPVIPVVRPVDLDSVSFKFNNTTKRFSITPVSTDGGNLLAAGSDGLASLVAAAVQNAQITYTSVLSADSKSIVFSKVVGSTATTLTTIPVQTTDMHVTSGTVDGSGNLVLTDADGTKITINLAAFLMSVTTANSNSISHTGSGTSASPIVAALTLDPLTGNLLKVTASGTKVAPADVLALLNANISHTLAVDTTNGVLTSTVNGKTASLNLAQLQAPDGTVLGYVLVGTAASAAAASGAGTEYLYGLKGCCVALPLFKLLRLSDIGKGLVQNVTTKLIDVLLSTQAGNGLSLDTSNALFCPPGQRILNNLFRNPSFNINQRAVSGTVTLAAYAYGHDGLVAAGNGATYTFAKAANGIDTIITLTAGQLVLPVAPELIDGSPLCLSYVGTAGFRVASAATVASGGAPSSGTAWNPSSFAQYPTGYVLSPTPAANSQVNIMFGDPANANNTVTFSVPQLERSIPV